MRGPDPSLRCAPFRMTSLAYVQDDKWGVGSELALSPFEGMISLAWVQSVVEGMTGVTCVRDHRYGT